MKTLLDNLTKEDLVFYTIDINLALFEVVDTLTFNESYRYLCEKALTEHWTLDKKIQLLNSLGGDIDD